MLWILSKFRLFPLGHFNWYQHLLIGGYLDRPIERWEIFAGIFKIRLYVKLQFLITQRFGQTPRQIILYCVDFITNSQYISHISCFYIISSFWFSSDLSLCYVISNDQNREVVLVVRRFSISNNGTDVVRVKDGESRVYRVCKMQIFCLSQGDDWRQIH